MLFKENHYCITSIQQTKVDETFIKISYTYQRQFPFKWDFFVHDVIDNHRIAYFKDTTAIFNLESIEFKDVSVLFHILKMYLNYKVIVKIIHKKEFIIAHFNPNFHMEYIKTPTILMSLSLYHIMINANFGKTYLGGILTTDYQKRIINIILETKHKLYIFDGNDKIDYQLSENCVVIRLYSKLKTISLNGLEQESIRLVYYEGDYLNALHRIIEKNEMTKNQEMNHS